MQSVSPISPTPSRRPKCLKGPDHSTSQCGEIGWRHRRRKILVPHLKGLVKPVTPCVYAQNARFFWGAFSLAPKKVGSVQPLLILSPYSGPARRQGLCSHF